MQYFELLFGKSQLIDLLLNLHTFNERLLLL